MSETPNPATSRGENRRQRIHATFTVETSSGSHASSMVRYLLRAVLEGRERHTDLEEPRSRMHSWWLTDGSQFAAWEPFEDTGIPEMVAEMFPPEPTRESFGTPAGGIDEDAFEGAHEIWREECLNLAVQASHLPEVLARLEKAEAFRDAVIDVMDRHRLPEPPRIHEYSQGFFGAGLDEPAYTQAQAQWQQNLQEAVTARETALESVLATGGDRTAYLPAQFQAEWLPRDLMAMTTLRALLDADPAVTTHLVDQDTRAHLAAMLVAADPDVRITDPDDPDGVELYEGPASEAHRWIPAGVFEARGAEGEGHFRVVVGPSAIGPENTASAAFPPAEHDSMVLQEISSVLETASPDASPQQVLQQVNQLVTGTGRPGRDEAETRLERGALLGDLLAQRGHDLAAPEQTQRPELGRDDPGLTR